MPRAHPLPLRATVAFVLCAGSLLLAGTSPAIAQVGYTGAPAAPPQDGYVGTYVGPASAVRPVDAGAGSSAATGARSGASRTASVPDAPQVDAAEPTEPGKGSVVTGWDLVTIAALGLAGVVAFAVSAGRFRPF